MIYIHYEGRLGNNLFQYAAAIVLSKKTGQKIHNPLKTRIIHFDNCLDTAKKGNLKIIDDSNFLEIFNSENHNSDYLLKGFFQFNDVISLFKQNVDIFEIPSQFIDHTFIHYRLGDLQTYPHVMNNYLTMDYFDSCLSENDSGLISSDSPDSFIVKEIVRKYNFQIAESDPESIILFASKFKKRVLSLGTFSWWIGFLGNGGNVFCPNMDNYQKWHGRIFDMEGWNKI